MNRSRTSAWLLPILLVSCRADDTAPPKLNDASPKSGDEKYEKPLPVPEGHDDVAIEAKLVAGEVVVTMTAGSGGHAFSSRGAKTADGVVEVRVRLTLPGRDEATTDALENLRIAIPVRKGKQPVKVLLQQVLRGAIYRTEPPFVLRHTLTR